MFGFFRRKPREAAPSPLEPVQPAGEEARVLPAGSFEVVGFNLRLLRFRSPLRLELGEPIELPVDLPGLGPTPFPAVVVARDPAPDATLYTAEVHAALPMRQHLFARFGTRDEEADREGSWEGPERRARPRFRTTCQARSKHLPGFQALTYDLTPEGARLTGREPMEPGAELQVMLDLDDALVDEVRLPARVLWSKPVPGGPGAWIGLQFTGGDPRQAGALSLYLERKVGR